MSLVDECKVVEYKVLGAGDHIGHGEVKIVLRMGFDPKFKTKPVLIERWAVTCNGNVLNTDGEWEWEPQPSSRDDDFLRRTRFASPEEALEAYKRRKP